jgi:hypothetical protein
MLSTYVSGISISRSVSMVQSCTKSSCFGISSLNRRFEFSALQFLDGFIQDLLVHFKTDLCHKAALLTTQHIARATDIQVAHSYLETTAQLTMLFQCLQAFAGIAGRYSSVAPSGNRKLSYCFCPRGRATGADHSSQTGVHY